MKKASILLLILAAGSFLPTVPANAQDNVAKFSPVGLFLETGDRWGADYSLSWGFERKFTRKLTAQIDIGVVLRRAVVNCLSQDPPYSNHYVSIADNSFLLKPRVNYYLLDEAPAGLYIGGYYTLAAGKNIGGGCSSPINGAFMSLGPQAGYQFLFFQKRLAVDGNIGIGPGFYVGNNTPSAGFHLHLAATAGYAF